MKDGTQEDFLNKSNAAFGRDSNIREHEAGSVEHVFNTTPLVDQTGRSEESSEGIVADHAPFSGIKDAIANQD